LVLFAWLAILAVSVYALLKRKKEEGGKEGTPKIPGPIRYPFVDNNPYLIYQGCIQKASAGYMDAYGDTVEFWVNGERWVTTCDPAIYKHVTLTNGSNYLRRFASPSILKYAMRSGSGIVFNPDVDNWRGHRRVFKRFVSTIVGPDASKIIVRNARNFTDHWTKFPDKTQINITEAMHNLSLDLTAELAFGIQLNSVTGQKSHMAQGIKDGIQAWMNSFHHFLVYPRYWEFLPQFVLEWTKGIIPVSKLIIDLENLGKIEQQIFETAPKSNLDGTSFLGSLAEMLEQNKDDKLLIDGLLQDIREMLAGGSDTSANTLAYTLYFIASNPSVERRVHAEIDEKFIEEDCKASVERMPYLTNVVKESLRLLPPGSLILRKAGQDDYFGKYFIPKDTNVLLNLWYTFTSPKYWDDPLAFNPDRFAGKTDFDPKFIPFGYGLRGCPGKPLAELELRGILAIVLKYFRLEIVAPTVLHPKWGLVEHCEDITMALHKRPQAV